MWTHVWPLEYYLCGRREERDPRSPCSPSHRKVRMPSDGEHKIEKPHV